MSAFDPRASRPGIGWRSAGGRRAVAHDALAVACVFLCQAILFLAAPMDPFPGDWSATMYGRDGKLLGATVARDGQWRFPSSGPVPERFFVAVTEYEDKRFYSHPGVDPVALARAAALNAASGEIVSGGSTIAMQVARLSRGQRPRNLAGKAVEALLALRLDWFSGKRRVMELYAANAPFGGNVVGLEAAAFRYFGRSPSELSWAEACALAVLPNDPALVHPGRNREALKAKRDSLLERLAGRGVIDAATLGLAKAEPLPGAPYPLPDIARHLFSLVTSGALPGGAQAKTFGGRIDTTISLDLQIRASAAVERSRLRLSGAGIGNQACLIADVDSGEILAWVGNSGTRETGGEGREVDLVTSRRSSGSILKPFFYAAALDTGEILPGQLLVDIPTRVGSYSPENSTNRYSGAVPADEALARSLNVPFVRELRSFGVGRFKRLLEDVGMTTLSRPADDYGLTLILGGAEATLLDAAGMYASLARTARRGGPESLFFPLTAIPRPVPASARQAPVSRGAAWLTLEALLKVARPEDEAMWEDYAGSKKIAWKTGTSFGYRDAWSFGVTSRYVVGVWVGNADGEGRPGIKGAQAAAPLLFDLFSLLPDSPWFQKPEIALKSIAVCAASGYAAGASCPDVREISVPLGASHYRACPYCRPVHLSPDGKRQVLAGDGEPYVTENRFALPPAVEYFYRRVRLGYKPLPPYGPGSAVRSGAARVALIFPEEGARIYVPIEVDGSPGMTVFQGAHSDRSERLYWHLDGEFLGMTEGDHRIECRPLPGIRVVTAMDGRGERASRTFEVLDRE